MSNCTPKGEKVKMEEQRKNNSVEMVPAYQYKILVCQNFDKDLEKLLNKFGKYGWRYADFRVKCNYETGTVILERKRMVPKPE